MLFNTQYILSIDRQEEDRQRKVVFAREELFEHMLPPTSVSADDQLPRFSSRFLMQYGKGGGGGGGR